MINKVTITEKELWVVYKMGLQEMIVRIMIYDACGPAHDYRKSVNQTWCRNTRQFLNDRPLVNFELYD